MASPLLLFSLRDRLIDVIVQLREILGLDLDLDLDLNLNLTCTADRGALGI
jgi:hypothetical protein